MQCDIGVECDEDYRLQPYSVYSIEGQSEKQTNPYSICICSVIHHPYCLIGEERSCVTPSSTSPPLGWGISPTDREYLHPVISNSAFLRTKGELLEDSLLKELCVPVFILVVLLRVWCTVNSEVYMSEVR